jgi:hypothetical protein
MALDNPHSVAQSGSQLMAITRRTLFGGAAALGAAGIAVPSSATAAEPLAPELLNQLWTSYYSGTRVWGYTDKHSVRPGQSFSLMLSVAPGAKQRHGTIQIFRIGAHGGADRKLAAEFPHTDIGSEPFRITSSVMGLCWPLGIDTIDTTGWASGYYSIDFIDDEDGNRDQNVAYIVVRPPDGPLDVLVGLSTNTYQAYNAWGGTSLYESPYKGDWGHMVSFDRPTPPDFFENEYFFVAWLERLAAEHGWTVGYASNFDIHCDRGLSQSCRLFVSGCHNEYWSKEEFDHIHERIFTLGKNTIFLGANSAYWQVRYVDINRPEGGDSRGRQLVCFKDMCDPIGERLSPEEALLLKTAMFRDQARRPETMLAGIAYESYFPSFSDARYPYHVARTDLPFFEGTGYAIGDAVGDVVGYEWDNRDPEGDGKRLWDPVKSKIPQLPAERIQVVFTGTPVDLNGKVGKAEAVYFTSPAGAKVFSTGSIRWAWGLGKPGFEQAASRRFNENLFVHFLKA